MALKKQIQIDEIKTCKMSDWYNLHVRESILIIENNNVISSDYNRYMIFPDHDVSTITDPVVKAQFEAVMTKEVKDNYATFLASKAEEVSE